MQIKSSEISSCIAIEYSELRLKLVIWVLAVTKKFLVNQDFDCLKTQFIKYLSYVHCTTKVPMSLY